jgi:hypothetical protein
VGSKLVNPNPGRRESRAEREYEASEQRRNSLSSAHSVSSRPGAPLPPPAMVRRCLSSTVRIPFPRSLPLLLCVLTPSNSFSPQLSNAPHFFHKPSFHRVSLVASYRSSAHGSFQLFIGSNVVKTGVFGFRCNVGGVDGAVFFI